MRKSIKLVALLLALLMFSTCLFACANDTTDPDQQGDDPTQGDDPAVEDPEENPEEEIIRPNIPETYDFGKKDMSFLYWFVESWTNTVRYCRDIYSESVIGEPIPDTVYYRNADIQEAYNVNITLEMQRHDVIINTITNQNASGDSTYLVTIPRLNEAGSLVTNGAFHNLYEVNHIDLTKPWWDQNSVEHLSSNDTLHLVATSLMVNDKDATAALAFSKDAIRDYELESPYQFVEDNTWTYETLADMAEQACSDLDGNDKMDKSDFWGFLGKSDVMPSFFHGSGGLFVVKDEDGLFQLNFGTSDDHFDATQDIQDYIMEADFFFNHHRQGIDDDEYTEMFMNGQGLFFWMRLDEVTNMRGSEINFGILPIPKFLEEQESYHSMVSQHTTGLLSIPLSTAGENLDMTGMILEAMSAHSHYDLQNEYIEISLKTRYARDDESEGMLDIILNNRVFDPALVFGFGNFASAYQDLHTGGNVASFFATKESATVKAIEEFNDKIAGY
jgi:hypothetical protein